MIPFVKSCHPGRRALASVAVFAFVSALTACSHPSGPPTTASPTPPTVATTTARLGSVTPSEHLAGIVAPFENVAISSTLSEPALSVNVQEGDVVRAGQVLAVLDTADLRATLAADLATAASAAASTAHTVDQGGLSIAQGVDVYNSARDAVAQAQATLKRDQIDLGRYQALLQHGYIAEQQVQQQQTTVLNDAKAVEAAMASAASAKSAMLANGSLTAQGGLQSTSVAQAKAQEQVALAQAQQERVLINKATITSPIDGVVVNRNLNSGEYPGTRQLFTLQQVDPIFVLLHGSAAQVADVVPGRSATVLASDSQHGTFVGQVVGVLNQINPGSTDFQVKLLVPNPTGRLRPGMPVEADVSLQPLQGVLIPTTAFTDDRQTAVLVVQAQGKVAQVAVVCEGSAATQSVVRGLAPGARVVVNGQSGLSVGQKVLPKESATQE